MAAGDGDVKRTSTATAAHNANADSRLNVSRPELRAVVVLQDETRASSCAALSNSASSGLHDLQEFSSPLLAARKNLQRVSRCVWRAALPADEDEDERISNNQLTGEDRSRGRGSLTSRLSHPPHTHLSSHIGP